MVFDGSLNFLLCLGVDAGISSLYSFFQALLTAVQEERVDVSWVEVSCGFVCVPLPDKCIPLIRLDLPWQFQTGELLCLRWRRRYLV